MLRVSNRTGGTIALAAALVLVLAGASWRYEYVHSPAYAIAQVESAAREHNRLRFERYVDLNRFATTTVDEVMGQATISALNKADDGFAALGTALGAGIADKMKPALASEMRSAVLHAVETGRLDSMFVSGRDTTKPNLTLASVARNMAVDRVDLVGLTPIQREGDVASIGLRLRNHLLDTTLTLRVRMEKESADWRIVAPDNLSEYLQTLETLKERRLAEVNAANLARMRALTESTPVRRSVIDYDYVGPYLILESTYVNKGRDSIALAVFRIYADGQSKGIADAAIIDASGVPPGGRGTLRRVYDYNQFIDWHVQLRFSSDLRIDPWFIVTRRGAKRDTLQVYASWQDYADDQ